MSLKKKNSQAKSKLHPRSKHRERYNFELLTHKVPELKTYVSPNKYGNLSIDFFNPDAVKALNKALLLHHYNLDYWDIPNQYLCPPIPGRADYIHYIADLIEDTSNNPNIIGFDIGTGANCIYPIIGLQSYGWHFIGSDIDEAAIDSAKHVLNQNPVLKDKIEIRLQENKVHKLKGILQPNEQIDFVMCNHAISCLC
ncbi:RlmF-related methyltransferase [uncultured Winogradskyella sp.]|uniref:RlmF-related methyltransferase n=1 Tax=uncultured Winogradskyella sp. TaxID=395353 RepID=UPI00261B22FC|nr:RlmF-related methyltransferase [uncultured Winogradskyella sp.]